MRKPVADGRRRWVVQTADLSVKRSRRTSADSTGLLYQGSSAGSNPVGYQQNQLLTRPDTSRRTIRRSDRPQPGRTRRSAPPQLGHRSAALKGLQEGVEPIDGLVGPVLEQPAVAGQGERHTVVTRPLRHLADVAPGGDQDREK